MVRLRPISPLFPYTTLFRSALVALHVLQVLDEQALAVGPVQRRGQAVVVGVAEQRLDVGALLRVEGDDPDGGRGVQRQDRKSTRLNSSHGYISYAVFCLKKK